MPRMVNTLMTDTGGSGGTRKKKTDMTVKERQEQVKNQYYASTSNVPDRYISATEPQNVTNPQTYSAPAAVQTQKTGGEEQLSYDPVSSQAYTDAMARLSALSGNPPTYNDPYAQQINDYIANKPGEYVDPFSDQLNAIYDQIVGRGKFQYDVNGDALYQQYKDLYTQQGQMAMQDTMGQAAALTGGYGSTYSQNVGQQTYNQYLQQLNAVIPELQGRAFSQWQAEGQDLQNQYALLKDRSDTGYNRHQDELSEYYRGLSELQSRSDTDYGRFLDQRSDYYNQIGLAQDEANTAYSRQNDERSRVMDLIGIGYTPSDAELAAAGMSTREAQAYIDYYNRLNQPSYSGGSSSSTGNDDVPGIPPVYGLKSGLGVGTDEKKANDIKNLEKNPSAEFGRTATTARTMQSAGVPVEDIQNMIFTLYDQNKLTDDEMEYLINTYA